MVIQLHVKRRGLMIRPSNVFELHKLEKNKPVDYVLCKRQTRGY